MNTVVLVDKPVGWTSFDVVAKVRGTIRATYTARGIRPTKRQLKVGHAGTLDPFATGLLIVLVGDACARAEQYIKLDKIYEATIVLGATSTTGDPEGVITAVSDTMPTLEAVQQALGCLTGDIEQRPPVFSAIKVHGERAYTLARRGVPVVLPSRPVTIYELVLLAYTYPYIQIRAHVSSGTYIRTLAEDIGRVLGVGGYCSALRRIRIGTMDIENSLTIEHLLADLQTSTE